MASKPSMNLKVRTIPSILHSTPTAPKRTRSISAEPASSSSTKKARVDVIAIDVEPVKETVEEATSQPRTERKERQADMQRALGIGHPSTHTGLPSIPEDVKAELRYEDSSPFEPEEGVFTMDEELEVERKLVSAVGHKGRFPWTDGPAPPIFNCKLTDELFDNWKSLPYKGYLLQNLTFRDLDKLFRAEKITSAQRSRCVTENLDDYLSFWHLDLEETLEVLAASHAVLTGELVLVVIFKHAFMPNELEITTTEKGVRKIFSMLRRRGYNRTVELSKEELRKLPQYNHRIREDPEHDDEDNHGPLKVQVIKEVYRLTHGTCNRGREVLVIVSTVPSPIAPLPMLNFTLLMNYIAHHGLVMFYPETTVNGFGHVQFDGEALPQKTQDYLAKLQRHGFGFTDNLKAVSALPNDFRNHQCSKSLNCPCTPRSLVDEGILHVPFGPWLDESDEELRNTRVKEEGAEWLEWELATGDKCGATVDEDEVCRINALMLVQ